MAAPAPLSCSHVCEDSTFFLKHRKKKTSWEVGGGLRLLDGEPASTPLLRKFAPVGVIRRGGLSYIIHPFRRGNVKYPSLDGLSRFMVLPS